MAALSLALSSVSTMSVGNKKQGTGILTLTASTSTYVTGGVAMPTGWKASLAAPNSVDFTMLSGPLMLATPALGIVGHVDLTTEKLVIFGGASTAAIDKPLEELPNAAGITDGAYVCQILVQGN